MFPSNKGKLFFLWCLLLSCFGFASSAQATLSIQEAVDLWILDGAEFHQMVKCSPQAQLNNGVQQIYYDSSSCVLSELATYALAKECFGESNANRVDMIDVNTKLNSITFDVTPSTCSLLEKKSTKAPKKRPTEKNFGLLMLARKFMLFSFIPAKPHQIKSLLGAPNYLYLSTI